MIFDCDANATYMPDPHYLAEAVARLSPLLSNPSAMHRRGQRAKAAVEEARERLRAAVGAGIQDTILFTSGATESNNTAFGVLRDSADHVVSSATEHPCVLAAVARREASFPGTTTLIRPGTDGAVALTALEDAIVPRTRLVSLMAANNEIGIITPIGSFVSAVRRQKSDVLFHTDAAQLLGKDVVAFRDSDVDLMTLSAHKIGALAGVGALVIKQGVACTPLLVGGSQEMKLRGGTENVLGIVLFSEVAEMVAGDLGNRRKRMLAARDCFESVIVDRLPDVVINGSQHERLPNTSSVYVPGIRADDLVVALDVAHVLVSTGAACTSGKREPSHVLLSMGQLEDQAMSTVRVSFRADILPEDARRVAELFVGCVGRMRSQGAQALLSRAIKREAA